MTQWQKIVMLVLVVSTVVLAGSTQYYYRQFQEIKKNPQKASQDDTDQLVKKVSQLMVLPEEPPSVATITDLEQVKGQPFFARAKVGDRVLIFSIAKKAVLYDPVNHKIVEVAPLNTGAPMGEPAPSQK
ncbi:MAG: hypothetical protein Q8R07_01640 [Candidatus Uhrbacteria bacterium]|nr:hypothetical protein [Candidatus Uhrbacteria bacterium]